MTLTSLTKQRGKSALYSRRWDGIAHVNHGYFSYHAAKNLRPFLSNVQRTAGSLGWNVFSVGLPIPLVHPIQSQLILQSLTCSAFTRSLISSEAHSSLLVCSAAIPSWEMHSSPIMDASVSATWVGVRWLLTSDVDAELLLWVSYKFNMTEIKQVSYFESYLTSSIVRLDFFVLELVSQWRLTYTMTFHLGISAD